MRRLLALLLILPPILPLPALAQDWCASPTLTTTEATICASPRLSQLDRRMSELYTRPSSGWAGKTLSQRDWLARRDACGGNEGCIEDAYLDRIARLKGPEDAADPTPPPGGQAGLRPWCRGPLGPTEATICTSPRLADMDAAMAAVYDAAGPSSGRRQLDWIRTERDVCGADRACIGQAYLERIVELGHDLRRP